MGSQASAPTSRLALFVKALAEGETGDGMIEETFTPGTAAEVALQWVPNESVVGLGTGRAARDFLHALAQRVAQGFKVAGVPTSVATARLAQALGIPLTDFDGAEPLAVAVDGADEVDPELDLIKGLGGALVRERVVAAASMTFVVIVGAEKLTPRLGALRRVVPIEVVPFALGFCRHRLASLGFDATPRRQGTELFLSDNGNPILDCVVNGDVATLEPILAELPGVVDHGIFRQCADVVIIQEPGGCRVRRRLAPA